eukprot:1571921-Rhodomonas_salina.2
MARNQMQAAFFPAQFVRGARAIAFDLAPYAINSVPQIVRRVLMNAFNVAPDSQAEVAYEREHAAYCEPALHYRPWYQQYQYHSLVPAVLGQYHRMVPAVLGQYHRLVPAVLPVQSHSLLPAMLARPLE